MRAVLPEDEATRLETLHHYRILDSPPEEAFDDFALLASHLCDMPVSLVSFIDDTRQWFKAKVGIELTETSRELAFCAHTILQRDVLIVPDATQDARFADNAFVTGAPNIRFYAGAPLVTPSGHAMGTLCVLDIRPRELTPAQIAALQALSRQVVAQLELRRALHEMEEQADSLRLLEAAIEQSSEAITITTADLNPPGPHILFVNPAFTRITGYSRVEALANTPRMLQGSKTERHVMDNLKSQLLKGLTFSGETINYRKDGSEFWMEWEVAPVRMKMDTVTHFVATQRDVSARRKAQEQMRSQFERMTALHAIDASITMQRDLYLTLGLLLDQMVVLLGIHAVDILLLSPRTQCLERAAWRGYEKDCLPPTPTALDEGMVGRAIMERRIITLADMQNEAPSAQSEWHNASRFKRPLRNALISKDQVRGVLRLCQRNHSTMIKIGGNFWNCSVGRRPLPLTTAN